MAALRKRSARLLQSGASRAAVAAVCAAFGLFSASRAEAISLCSFGSAVGVAFGSYDVFSGTSLDSTGSLQYSCASVGLNDVITIALSRGSSSSFFARRMSNGVSTLDYNLYTSATRTVVWGDGSAGTSVFGPVHPPLVGGSTVTIFGRVPALQNVPVGAYSDAIVATINF